jgi:hypothetical protein
LLALITTQIIYEEKTKKQHFPENKKGHAEHYKNMVIILVA